MELVGDEVVEVQTPDALVVGEANDLFGVVAQSGLGSGAGDGLWELKESNLWVPLVAARWH